ncbi:TRI39 ligase, partial [Alectura lathami]|nr:TRI39 ligase [Alectura lathami]
TKMSAEGLQDKVTCSICLKLFQDPVSIHCGHSFCQGCIIQHWEGRRTNFSCPQCRETAPFPSLRPNRELASIVPVAKCLSLPSKRGMGKGEDLCQEHQEALNLFCEDEQKFICWECNMSKLHCDHSVWLVEDITQEYKEKIQTRVQALKEEQKELRGFIKAEDKSVQRHTVAEKRKIVASFMQMRKILDEKEELLLSQLENLHVEIQKSHKETLSKLSRELSSTSTLISEMEKKCQQPGCELLKDIQTTLSRCERKTSSKSPEISPDLERRFTDFTAKTASINIKVEVIEEKRDFLPPTEVTLDPKTAHANLHLSEDCKEVWWEDTRQVLPRNAERFNVRPCVLGSRGFTSGRHCWDVQLCKQGEWAIGVAKGSMQRKGLDCLQAEGWIWALWQRGGHCKPRTSYSSAFLELHNVPEKIRIYLNYKNGKVVFFDAVSKETIFAFWSASFNREKVYPWFLVGKGTHLK